VWPQCWLCAVCAVGHVGCIVGGGGVPCGGKHIIIEGHVEDKGPLYYMPVLLRALRLRLAAL